MITYNRYQQFRMNGTFKQVPFIKIPVRDTDMYTYYEAGKTRFDLLSYQYYDNPNYGWLILQANPEIGSLEYRIPDGTRLRIPYPLETVIKEYQSDIENYIRLYGIE